MPLWAYNMSPLQLALIMVATIEAVSLVGLFLTRRFILPHLRFHDGINDAISGAVQTIGVFYGITVGLIAVGVWNTIENDDEVVSKEAAAPERCIRRTGYPEPVRATIAGRSSVVHAGAIDRLAGQQRVDYSMSEPTHGRFSITYIHEPTTRAEHFTPKT